MQKPLSTSLLLGSFSLGVLTACGPTDFGPTSEDTGVSTDATDGGGSDGTLPDSARGDAGADVGIPAFNPAGNWNWRVRTMTTSLGERAVGEVETRYTVAPEKVTSATPDVLRVTFLEEPPRSGTWVTTWNPARREVTFGGEIPISISLDETHAGNFVIAWSETRLFNSTCQQRREIRQELSFNASGSALTFKMVDQRSFTDLPRVPGKPNCQEIFLAGRTEFETCAATGPGPVPVCDLSGDNAYWHTLYRAGVFRNESFGSLSMIRVMFFIDGTRN